MVTQAFKAITRWMGYMTLAGAVVGIAALLAAEWAVRFIDDSTGAVELAAPMILTMGALVIAPAIIAAIGVYTGRRTAGRTALVEAAVGSLTGTVLYAGIALLFIGQYSSFAGSAPTVTDIASIAGLVALTAVVAGTVAVAATPTATERETADVSPVITTSESTA